MNNTSRTGGQKILFALIFVIGIAIVPAKAQLLNELLNRVEIHRKSLKSLRADIFMRKYNPDLKEKNDSTGKVVFVPASKKIKQTLFRLDWESPRKETLIVNKGKYYAYAAGADQAYQGKADARKAQSKGGSAFSIFSMSKTELNSSFKPELIGEEKLDGGVSAFHIKFTPKAKSNYKSIDIWMDKDGMIHQVKMVPAAGDESFVRLTNIEKNPTIDSSIFDIKLPAGTKIVNG